MRLALIIASLGLSSVAAAGGYVGLGMGPRPAVDSATLDAYGRTGRLFVGYRLTRFSVEGALTANSSSADLTRNPDDYTAKHLTLMGKYSHPLDAGFEVFGKAGLQWSAYSSEAGAETIDGSGIALAAGVEYRLSIGIAAASVFLEYGLSNVDVGQDTTADSITSRQWLLGVSLGM